MAQEIISDTLTSNMLVQPTNMRGLEKSVIHQRLLLVATLDGRLLAFDRYSGHQYWENGQLGGPLLVGRNMPVAEDKPMYLFEPHGAAPMYIYLPESGIQVLKSYYSI